MLISGNFSCICELDVLNIVFQYIQGKKPCKLEKHKPLPETPDKDYPNLPIVVSRSDSPEGILYFT